MIMSDEKRRALRTQGRFSGGSTDKGRLKRKEKEFKNENGEDVRRKSYPTTADSNQNVQYEENSPFSFEELAPKKKAEEIRTPGEHFLSESANGISRIFYEPDFLAEEEAEGWMDELRRSTPWNEKNIVIRGQEYPQPRLVAWYGPFPYSYSGVILEPAEMPELVQCIKQRVKKALESLGLDSVELNSVLLNYYRDDNDSVAWHSDDELTMGVQPTIASVSLGEVRRFEMRRKYHMYENESEYSQHAEHFVNMKSGSLLVMDGCMQQDWDHRVPKEYHHKDPRINLTFRTVYQLEKEYMEFPFKKIHEPIPCLQRSSSSQMEAEENEDKPLSKSQEETISQEEHPMPIDNRSQVIETVEHPLSIGKKSCAQIESSNVAMNHSEEECWDTETTDVHSESSGSSGIHKNTTSVPANSLQSKPLNIDAPTFIPRIASPVISPSFNLASIDTPTFFPMVDPMGEPPILPPSSKIAKEDPLLSTADELLLLCERIPKMSIEELTSSTNLLMDSLPCIKEFSVRDAAELDVLCAIMDGSQTDRNRNIICKRIEKLVHAAAFRMLKDVPEYPHRGRQGRVYSNKKASAPRKDQHNRTRYSESRYHAPTLKD